MKRWREFSGSYAPHNPILATVEQWTGAAAPGSPLAGLINRTPRAPAQVSANPKSALTPIPQLGRGTNPKQVKCVAHGETCSATSRRHPSNCPATAATPRWTDAANATLLLRPSIGCAPAARRRTRRGATCCLCLGLNPTGVPAWVLIGSHRGDALLDGMKVDAEKSRKLSPSTDVTLVRKDVGNI